MMEKISRDPAIQKIIVSLVEAKRFKKAEFAALPISSANKKNWSIPQEVAEAEGDVLR